MTTGVEVVGLETAVRNYHHTMGMEQMMARLLAELRTDWKR
jgi:hypothetical protein